MHPTLQTKDWSGTHVGEPQVLVLWKRLLAAGRCCCHGSGSKRREVVGSVIGGARSRVEAGLLTGLLTEDSKFEMW